MIDIKCKAENFKLIPVEQIVPNPRNNNRHSIEQINAIAKLIKAHGFREPLTISNRSGFLNCGHARLEAAKTLGMSELPVIYQDFASEAEEYQHMTADNEIARWAELDFQGVYDALKEIPDIDTSLLGIEDFKLPEVVEPQADEDEVPEAMPEPKVVRGEVYILGNHRLMCGDSTAITDVERLMNGEKADMVFTDPPYGDDHAMSDMVPMSERKQGKSIVSGVRKIKNDDNIDFLSEVSNSIFPFLKSDYSAFIFFKWNKWEKIKEYFSVFGNPKTVCVWDRDSQGASTFRINPVHEFCFYWGTLGDKKETGNLRNVWRCKKERDSKQMHPTVKPIEIIETPIRMCCEIGGVVLDVFGGSGSTLIACEKTNRKCFMMELDSHYCGVILDRWQNFTGKKAHREDGIAWDKIKESV
jgi:DNA modification methylase